MKKEEEPEKPIIYKQTAGTKVILEEEQKKEIVYKKTGDVKIVHPEVPNHTHHVVHKPVHGKEVEQTLPAVHDKLFTYVSGTHTERVHPQKPHHDKIQKYDRHGKVGASHIVLFFPAWFQHHCWGDAMNTIRAPKRLCRSGDILVNVFEFSIQ